MAANTAPIFTKNGHLGSVLVTAANTSSQGGGTIGTDIFLAFTADATNGSYVQFLRWIATGTATTTTTATTARVFISSVASGATTSANTFLWKEVSLPAVSADNSTGVVNEFDVPLGFVLPAAFTILVTCHVAPAANTAQRATVIAGDL